MGLDLNRGGQAGDELDPLRNLVDVNAHRHALGEAHEGEERIDCGQPAGVRDGVRDIDAAREPLNPAAQQGGISHELDRRRVALMDPAKSGLLEIGVDPERVRIDDRKLESPDIGVVAELGGKVGDVTIDRRANLRALKIDPRLVEIRERRLVGGLGVRRLTDKGLPLLHRDRDVVELEPADHFGVGVLGDRSRLLDRRLRLPDGDRVVPGIDQHEQVALADELIVCDRQFHDLAGDLRGDFDDIGAHRAVARPRRTHVILPSRISERGGGADGRGRDENRQNPQGR